MNIHNSKKLLAFINDNITPDTLLKKATGVVFTPLSIVDRMLSKLPAIVWTNPTYRWLDPCAGIGNYSIMIYYNLMDGLQAWESDEELRRKHILENMLFMIEINPTSIATLHDIFCHKAYKLNIYHMSFLDYDKGVYDIIIGNPPYNEKGTGRTNGSRQPFWPKFIEQALHLINEEGYISFIHPVGWRKPYNTNMQTNIGKYLLRYVTDGSLIHIKLDDVIIPHFPPVDHYVYQNKKNMLTTIESRFNDIQGISHNIDLRATISESMSILPSFYTTKAHSIFTKLFASYNDNPTYNIIYDGYLKPNKSMKNGDKVGVPYAFIFKDGTYEEVYDKEKYDTKMKKLEALRTHTCSSKMKDKEDLLDYYHKPKLIMSFSGSQPLCTLNPVFYDKVMGSSNMTMYLPVADKEESIIQCNFFKSNLITFLLKLTQYSPPPRNKNEHKILNHIQIPNLQDSPTPTDEDIYDYYKLTASERTLIESIIS